MLLLRLIRFWVGSSYPRLFIANDRFRADSGTQPGPESECANGGFRPGADQITHRETLPFGFSNHSVYA
jgi:hypothetical protein